MIQVAETRDSEIEMLSSCIIIRHNCAQCPIGQMTTYCSSCMSHKVPKNFIQWRSRAVGTRGPGISSWGLRTSDKLSRRKKKGRVSSMRSIFWEKLSSAFWRHRLVYLIDGVYICSKLSPKLFRLASFLWGYEFLEHKPPNFGTIIVKI